MLVIGSAMSCDLQARLRLADVVEKEDVNEAMRLMEMSKDSLNTNQEPGRCVSYRNYLHLWHRTFG